MQVRGISIGLIIAIIVLIVAFLSLVTSISIANLAIWLIIGLSLAVILG